VFLNSPGFDALEVPGADSRGAAGHGAAAGPQCSPGTNPNSHSDKDPSEWIGSLDPRGMPGISKSNSFIQTAKL